MSANCPLCDHPASFWLAAGDRHYGNPGTWDLYRCQNCLHGFEHPFPDQETLSSYYPSDYYTHDAPTTDFTPKGLHLRRPWLQMHYLKFRRGYAHLHLRSSYWLALAGQALQMVPLDFNSPRFIPGGTLLDFGCGSGQYVAFARFAGWNTEGMDIDEAAVRTGMQSGLPLMHGSIDLLNTLEGRYDYIRSSHSAEHVIDVNSLFKAFWKALKPGGTLAVDVPNADCASMKHYKEYYYYLGLPVHIHLFSPQSITLAASKAGFRDIVLSTYSVWYTQEASAQLRRNASDWKFESKGFPKEAKFNLLWKLRTLPTYVRSLGHLSGDCLVMKASKPSTKVRTDSHGAF